MTSRKSSLPERSTFPGGIGVVEFHMRTRLYRKLTLEQASSLWEECKAMLQKHDLQETVDECEESQGGGLDTLPRGDVLDALARVLAGRDWPMNMTGQAESDAFIEKLRTAIIERGYARSEEQPA